MRSKRLLYGAAALACWLGLWEVAAYHLALPFAIPTVEATAAALWHLWQTANFWQTLAQSLGRILLGLAEGTLLGALLALLSVWSRLVRAIVSPMQAVVRATPVASFIMVLWIIVGRDAVPTAIALLMVMPVIWQGLCDGYAQLDPELDDVVRSFHASPAQRLTMFVLPSLRRSFLTALLTAAGLAWKAGIAAEIIAYTAHSIGREISDARNLFDGPEMMAWSICVVLMSLAIERLIRAVLGDKPR